MGDGDTVNNKTALMEATPCGGRQTGIQNRIHARHKPRAGHQWLMPIILATQEAEIRRIEVRSQPGQIVHKTLSQKTHQKKAGGVGQGEGPGVGQGEGPEFKPQYCKYIYVYIYLYLYLYMYYINNITFLYFEVACPKMSTETTQLLPSTPSFCSFTPSCTTFPILLASMYEPHISFCPWQRGLPCRTLESAHIGALASSSSHRTEKTGGRGRETKVG
jgi:hypothetical protein